MRGVRLRSLLGLTLGTIVSANLLGNRIAPTADAFVRLGMVGGLAATARAGDLGAADLGLSRRVRCAGLRWGGISAAVVAAGYDLAAAIPAVRDVTVREITHDSARCWSAGVVKALVVIPLVTVLPEEFAFRGVLLGLLRRAGGRRTATIVSSAIFGLWHVLPSLGGDGAANESVAGVIGDGPAGTLFRVIGTVIVTGLAGVVCCELRDRSGSLLAPVLLHWAINGFGELFLLVT